MHNIEAIKASLDLVDMFRLDGLDPKRIGSSTFVCCPFHDEKTPSCKITADRFHCFGCEASGDVLDYWQRTRHLGLHETLNQLAGLADVDSMEKFTPKLPRPSKKPESLPQSLSPRDAREWSAATHRLASSPLEIQRIAQWRSFPEDLVTWAADQELMGLFPWRGVLREAFVVERHDLTQGVVPVSIHVRLGPNTPGNASDKASWRYHPTGQNSWPMIVGAINSKYVFVLEGEWDALALIGLSGFHRKWPFDTCVIGIRGATSFRHLLENLPLSKNSTVFVFPDSDPAGAGWHKTGGFIDDLHTISRRVHCFMHSNKGKDFNDLVRDGLTRDDLSRLLLPTLPSPRHAKPKGPTFHQWCKIHQDDGGSVSRAAKIVILDKERPRGSKHLPIWERHWHRIGIQKELLAELKNLWSTYRSEVTSA